MKAPSKLLYRNRKLPVGEKINKWCKEELGQKRIVAYLLVSTQQVSAQKPLCFACHGTNLIRRKSTRDWSNMVEKLTLSRFEANLEPKVRNYKSENAMKCCAVWGPIVSNTLIKLFSGGPNRFKNSSSCFFDTIGDSSSCSPTSWWWKIAAGEQNTYRDPKRSPQDKLDQPLWMFPA